MRMQDIHGLHGAQPSRQRNELSYDLHWLRRRHQPPTGLKKYRIQSIIYPHLFLSNKQGTGGETPTSREPLIKARGEMPSSKKINNFPPDFINSKL